MVIKFFGPKDKRGVYWPPYTAKERQEIEDNMYRRKHNGPVVMVRPAPRSAAAASNNKPTDTSSKSRTK